MRHDRDEVGAGLVDGAQALELRLRLGVEAALLDERGEEAGERLEEARGSAGENSRASTVWTLSTPTTWSSQTSGTEHIEVKRAWSTPRIQAKRRVVGDVRARRRVLRVAAAMPVMPWPIARRATPTASWSRPFVAASVTPLPSRSVR